MFLKYDIKCPTYITSNDQIGFGVAKWSHIKEFYETDNTNPNFVFAPCLKQEHLNPNTKQKMKVKLAAQVLSHSVAAGMYAKISQGELSSEAVTTANVIANMDKLFDSTLLEVSDTNTLDDIGLGRGKGPLTNEVNSPRFEGEGEARLECQGILELESRGSPRFEGEGEARLDGQGMLRLESRESPRFMGEGEARLECLGMLRLESRGSPRFEG
ncbi:unnamed protein product [Parnassius apollo]|uniref:(apollo) hypothetical protein n=1 Tax=Parnassius apollo TaxID=110799 RepID=A0A8S3WBR8_PARAO|nr:unnamed protein product [Parnassius apollo]